MKDFSIEFSTQRHPALSLVEFLIRLWERSRWKPNPQSN
jgi:hypothetical protein